jgi:Uma2 family endonuclease
MEIISPDSGARDWREKYNDYQAAGVREYWIVDPAGQAIEAYSLGPDAKYSRLDDKDDRINSTIVPGWYIKPSWLWQEKRPSVLDVLAELGVK